MFAEHVDTGIGKSTRAGNLRRDFRRAKVCVPFGIVDADNEHETRHTFFADGDDLILFHIVIQIDGQGADERFIERKRYERSHSFVVGRDGIAGRLIFGFSRSDGCYDPRTRKMFGRFSDKDAGDENQRDDESRDHKQHGDRFVEFVVFRFCTASGGRSGF